MLILHYYLHMFVHHYLHFQLNNLVLLDCYMLLVIEMYNV